MARAKAVRPAPQVVALEQPERIVTLEERVSFYLAGLASENARRWRAYRHEEESVAIDARRVVERVAAGRDLLGHEMRSSEPLRAALEAAREAQARFLDAAGQLDREGYRTARAVSQMVIALGELAGAAR